MVTITIAIAKTIMTISNSAVDIGVKKNCFDVAVLRLYKSSG
ncbi:hypothetical protein [Nostoc sp. CHAB 5836]|nr:hypothetical protein [Nostoc sp. CHAB 5836]